MAENQVNGADQQDAPQFHIQRIYTKIFLSKLLTLQRSSKKSGNQKLS